MFIAVAKEQFQRAAAEGAWLELNLRLLADKTSGLDAYAPSLDSIEGQIAKVFAGHLSAEDMDTLRLSRQLRNKLLHGDFHQARQRLQELGVPAQRGGVLKMSIAPEASTLKAIQLGLENIDSIPAVADMSSTKAAGIFGWLLELWQSGALQAAEHGFSDANAIVDRLMLVEL